MKKILYLSLTVLLLASCDAPKPLYTWSKYETTSYNYVKNSNEKSTKILIEDYQKIIDKQKGSRGVVPPGVYADYGFVLIQSNRMEEGKVMLQKEIELYPESKMFIDKIFKMIQ